MSFTEWNRQKVIRLVFIHQNYTGMAWFLVGPSQLHSVLLRIVIRQVCVCPLKTGSPLLEAWNWSIVHATVINLLFCWEIQIHWTDMLLNIIHIRHRVNIVNDNVFRISCYCEGYEVYRYRIRIRLRCGAKGAHQAGCCGCAAICARNKINRPLESNFCCNYGYEL